MSRYVAGIVQRDGVMRYLVRGRLTDMQSVATHYPRPSSAKRAIARALNQWKWSTDRCATVVYDTRDPERGDIS